MATTATMEMTSMAAAHDMEAGQGTGPATSIMMMELPEEPEINKGFLKPIPETTMMERVAGIVACGAVATALVAMIVEQSAIVIVGGVLSIIIGPYAYWQETRLTDIKALKETEEAIRLIVDSMTQENERLAASIEDMTESVNKLEDVEQALEIMTQTQGNAVEKLTEDVANYKRTLASMQASVKGEILRNLLSIFDRIDTDGDSKISDSEIEDCMKRVKNVPGVQVREEPFRAAFRGQTTGAVTGLLLNLLKDDLPDGERIFIIQH